LATPHQRTGYPSRTACLEAPGGVKAAGPECGKSGGQLKRRANAASTAGIGVLRRLHAGPLGPDASRRAAPRCSYGGATRGGPVPVRIPPSPFPSSTYG